MGVRNAGKCSAASALYESERAFIDPHFAPQSSFRGGLVDTIQHYQHVYVCSYSIQLPPGVYLLVFLLQQI